MPLQGDLDSRYAHSLMSLPPSLSILRLTRPWNHIFSRFSPSERRCAGCERALRAKLSFLMPAKPVRNQSEVSPTNDNLMLLFCLRSDFPSATANNPHGWQETGQSGKVSDRVGIGAREGVAAEAPPSVRSATLFLRSPCPSIGRGYRYEKVPCSKPA